jgi:hypothetical protein
MHYGKEKVDFTHNEVCMVFLSSILKDSDTSISISRACIDTPKDLIGRGI